MRQWVEEEPPNSSLNPSGSRFRIQMSFFCALGWPVPPLVPSAGWADGPHAASRSAVASPQSSAFIRFIIAFTIMSFRVRPKADEESVAPAYGFLAFGSE